MHQRYNKLKYHKLYHSIPISCAFALLLLTVLCISPIGSKGIVSSDGDASAADLTTSSDDTSAALIVDDGNIEDVILAESGVNYKSHNIKIKAANIESYTLQISASSNGTSELKLDGGDTTIPGAGGVVGSNMPTNTWGYAWGDANATESSMTYYTLPAYGKVGTTLATGLLDSGTPTNNTIDTSNKLSFAANFSDNIPSGHYTTSVLLSLAVEPKKLTLGNIEYMQDVTPEICAATPFADAAGNNQFTLIDRRVASSEPGYQYTVAHLKNSKDEDAGCWMTQNLALPGGTIISISDSDLDPSVFTYTNKTYTLPTTKNTGGFDNTNFKDSKNAETYANQQVRNVANPDTNKYGAYYSWCAATAGTCLQGAYADIIPNSNNAGNAGNVSSTVAVPDGQNATSSICPKGWQLPVNGGVTTNKSYAKLLSGLFDASSIVTTPYNFVYSGAIHDSSLLDTGSQGGYWSSTANKSGGAYYMGFGIYVIPSETDSRYIGRYFGRSVRCVAR